MKDEKPFSLLIEKTRFDKYWVVILPYFILPTVHTYCPAYSRLLKTTNEKAITNAFKRNPKITGTEAVEEFLDIYGRVLIGRQELN